MSESVENMIPKPPTRQTWAESELVGGNKSEATQQFQESEKSLENFKSDDKGSKY